MISYAGGMNQEKKYPARKPTTSAERKNIVEQFHRSGLNRKAFAEKQGIPLYSLNRWLAKANSKKSKNPTLPFGEIQLLPSFSSCSWAMEIVSPSGMILRFRERPRIEDLTPIIRGQGC